MRPPARAALAALAVLAAACGLGGQASSPAPSAAMPTATPRTTLPPDPTPTPTPVPLPALAVEAEIPLGAALASEIGVAEDAVWVGTNVGLARIDPASNQVTATVELFGGARRLAVGFGSAWVPDFEANLVRRVDLASGEEVGAVPVGPNPEDALVAADAVWVSNHRGGTVSRIDPAGMAVTATAEVAVAGPGGPQALVFAADGVWVGVPGASAVVRLDATSATEAARVALERVVPCGGMAAGEDGVWVTSCTESTFAALVDASGATLTAEVDLGAFAAEPLVLDGAVWMPLLPAVEGATARLVPAATDPRPGAGFALAPGLAPSGAAVGFGSLWVSDFAAGRVIRHALPAAAP